MILVGILYKGGNLAMPTYAYKEYNDTFLSEEKDIHEAASTVWWFFHNQPWNIYKECIKAEMHDTETHRTWSVDLQGHTLKDYHTEKTNDFRNRYKKIGAEVIE